MLPFSLSPCGAHCQTYEAVISAEREDEDAGRGRGHGDGRRREEAQQEGRRHRWHTEYARAALFRRSSRKGKFIWLCSHNVINVMIFEVSTKNTLKTVLLQQRIEVLRTSVAVRRKTF